MGQGLGGSILLKNVRPCCIHDIAHAAEKKIRTYNRHGSLCFRVLQKRSQSQQFQESKTMLILPLSFLPEREYANASVSRLADVLPAYSLRL